METDDELSENNRARCFSLIGNSLCRGQKRGEKDEKCFNSRNWGGGEENFHSGGACSWHCHMGMFLGLKKSRSVFHSDSCHVRSSEMIAVDFFQDCGFLLSPHGSLCADVEISSGQ